MLPAQVLRDRDDRRCDCEDDNQPDGDSEEKATQRLLAYRAGALKASLLEAAVLGRAYEALPA